MLLTSPPLVRTHSFWIENIFLTPINLDLLLEGPTPHVITQRDRISTGILGRHKSAQSIMGVSDLGSKSQGPADLQMLQSQLLS